LAYVIDATSSISTKELSIVRKALLLLVLFAFGISMMVNGCGTLLQALN
jgi:hypothetical protein